jgi:hypothetical protein
VHRRHFSYRKYVHPVTESGTRKTSSFRFNNVNRRRAQLSIKAAKLLVKVGCNKALCVSACVSILLMNTSGNVASCHADPILKRLPLIKKHKHMALCQRTCWADYDGRMSRINHLSAPHCRMHMTSQTPYDAFANVVQTGHY